MSEAPSELRNRLDKVLDGISDEYLQSVVADLFSMTKLKAAVVDFTCKKCGHQAEYKAQISAPDYRGIAAALATLMDQGKGKPKEAAPAEVSDDTLRQVVREEIQKALTFDPATL